MADVDGKIQLSIGLTAEDAVRQAQKLGSTIDKIFSNVDASKMTQQMNKLQSTMSKTESQIQSTINQLDLMEQQLDRAQQWQELAKQVEDYDSQLEQLRDQLETVGDVRAAEDLRHQIEELEAEATPLMQTMLELQQAGKTTFTEEDANRVVDLKNKLGDLNNQQRLNIAAFQGLAEEAQKTGEAKTSLDELTLSAGKIDPAIEKAVNKFNTLEFTISQVKKRMSELEAAGVGVGYEEYNRLAEQLSKMEEEYQKVGKEIDAYKNRLAGVKTENEATAQRFEGLYNAVEKTASAFVKFANVAARLAGVGPVIDGLKSKISGLVQHLTKGSSAAGNFSSAIQGGIKKLLAYGLGIASLTALFKKMRGAITEGIKAMAQMNDGSNQTNVMMTQLTSSLNLLKGALATAFLPILSVVSPILSNLMQQLAEVISFIGMFIAKLTGAKSYSKAVFKSTDYAGSLSKSGSKGKTAQEKYEEAVKKAQKKYDDAVERITKSNEKKEDKAEEKNANNLAKAEDKQAKAAAKLAKEQEKANNKLAGFDDINVLAKDSTEEEISALEELKEVEADLAEMPELEMPSLEDFMDAGGGGADSPFGLVEVPLDNIEWNWDDIKAKAEELGRGIADKLNNFFSNEDWAKEIGRNIAEALNTALHFAYGFIDELDWIQMGRWFGALIKTGIETFEWGLLGRTIGELLNGIADTIIGFFQRYPVGLLGDSMATMLNNAVNTIDAGKIGTAINQVLKAPFIELSHFFTSTNWSQVGSKLTTFFHNAVSGTSFDGNTLGGSIGQFLADGVNAGIKLLLGADIRTAVADITEFFGDMFRKALLGIKWGELFQALWQSLVGVLTGFVQGLITFAVDLIIDLIEKKHPELTGKLEAMRADIHAEIEEACQDTEALLTGTMDEVERQRDRFNSAIADMIDIMTDWSTGAAVDWEQRLMGIQEQYELTDEDMDTLISTFAAMDDEFNNSSDILEGYTGDWAEYKKTIEDTDEPIKIAKENQEDLEKAVEDVGETAEETSGKVKDYVKIASDEIDKGKDNVGEYKDNTVEDLQTISDKSRDVQLDFNSMTEQIDAELTSLGEQIDSWYNTLLENYFSYDAWYSMLQQGILLALNDFLTIDFINNWDINIRSWWEVHVKPWFAAEKWQAELFSPLFTSIQQKWDTLMKWWDTSTKTWYTKVQSQWKTLNTWWDTSTKTWFTNLQAKWKTLDTWFDNTLETWYNKLKKKWETLSKWLTEEWDKYTKKWFEELQEKFDKLSKWFNESWDNITEEWFNHLQEQWDELMSWFDDSMDDWWSNHVEPWFEQQKWEELFVNIKHAADEVMPEVKDSLVEPFEAAGEEIQNICNGIIDTIDQMIQKMNEAINLAKEFKESGGMGGAGSSGGSGSFGGGSSQGGGGGTRGFMPALDIMHFEDNLGMSAFKFPELATGAVIPPNNRFLAVLGDQKSGTNIETPLNTMLEAFRSVMDEYNRPAQQNATMEMDGETFARLALPYLLDEMHRQGYNTEIITEGT